MNIKIYGNNDDTNVLLKNMNFAIEELGLSSFIDVEITDDEKLKSELNITKEPALIIEEKSIDFRDTIFEGIVPEVDELKSMLVSLIGGGDGSCSGCSISSCSSRCSCH